MKYWITAIDSPLQYYSNRNSSTSASIIIDSPDIYGRKFTGNNLPLESVN